MKSCSRKRLSSCTGHGKSFITKGTLAVPKKATEQEKPLAILCGHRKIHGRREPFVCGECGKKLSSKRSFATHQRNHLKHGQRETGSRVNRASRTKPFQTAQIKEESDMPLKPSEAFRGEDKVPVSGTPVQMERDIGEYVGSPKMVVSTSWGIQVKEEREMTKEWKLTMVEDFALHLESSGGDGSRETVYQDNRLSPRISPVLPLGSQIVNRMEGTAAGADHRTDVQKIYIKQEALESAEYERDIPPIPTPIAAQRNQIKKETDTEGEHPLEMQCGKKGSPQLSRLANHRVAAAVAFAESCEAERREGESAVKKEDRIFLCPVCGKGFSQKFNLTRHHKIHTTEGPYKCSECGESFRMNRQLLRHQRTHMSEPFKCPECGRSFKQRSNLVRHQRIHTREAPYQCPECEKTFNQKGNLFRHRMIHIRMGPCNCTKCGKFFTQRKNLVRHQKLHMSDGAHRCSTCGKRFRLEKYLRRHQKIHSQKPPYTCKIRGMVLV